LVLIVLCAQILELYALLALSDSAPAANESLDAGQFVSTALSIFGPVLGPFIGFAITGLAFRHFYAALWCLVLLATAYALLVLLGIAVEVGMAQEAIAAAERGSRYMNCAGHPRLFLFLFALPVTFGIITISGFVLVAESGIKTLLRLPVNTTH
jgi:hypothetical protein